MFLGHQCIVCSCHSHDYQAFVSVIAVDTVTHETWLTFAFEAAVFVGTGGILVTVIQTFLALIDIFALTTLADESIFATTRE